MMEVSAESTPIEDQIARYLVDAGWLPELKSVRFLAAGEYNENYLVESDGENYVFRINHGTQLGLSNQIEYEYSVLQAVEPSGVTPRPLFVDGDAPAFGNGALLMEYVSGTSMDYQRDWQAASEVFARIHQLPTSSALIHQQRPIASIAGESTGLLHRHDPHPLPDVGKRIGAYGETVLDLAGRFDPLFARDQQCIVNTEVNSGNFIVNPDRLVLVDWEKAVASCRYQDLGHFLVPTTTLWKSDYRFPSDARRAFLSAYKDTVGTAISLDQIDELTNVMEKTILFRALSWCYMAYAEYGGALRNLKNPDTFDRITYYLEHAYEFLGV